MSSTEMVSFPRELSDDLAELIATRARVCGGGAFEIWEAICEGFGAPASQRHDPIAWMVGTAIWWIKEEAERDAAATGKAITPFGPLIDTGEVERLRKALKLAAHWCDSALNAAKGSVDASESIRDMACLLRHQAEDIQAALSGSAEPSDECAHSYANGMGCPECGEKFGTEPSAPIAWHVGGNGYDRICFEEPTDLPGRPCIQAIHNQRRLIELLKRYDLREEDAPADERANGIPGTSFQRLNALANQGE